MKTATLARLVIRAGKICLQGEMFSDTTFF